jgi:hypothetical protein
MNATGAGLKIQESDVTGPAVNLRLLVAIQPPRSVSPGFVLT